MLQDHDRTIRSYRAEHNGENPHWCPAEEEPTILMRFLQDDELIKNQAESGFYGMSEPNECSDYNDLPEPKGAPGIRCSLYG